MYEFVYEYCIPKWGADNFRICQTDTDSVICEIKTKDLYADIAPDIKERFDASKYVRTDFNGTRIPKMNRKVLGKMKDELSGQIVTEFVGIGPKNYSFAYITAEGKTDEKSVCKGISKSYKPRFHEYKKVVKGEQKNVHKTCLRIGSKEHELYTIETDKVALTNDVRKRVRDLTTKYETLPFGAEVFYQS